MSECGEKNSEARNVLALRLREARNAGLTNIEANMFARNDALEMRILRRLVEKQAPPHLIARIVL